MHHHYHSGSKKCRSFYKPEAAPIMLFLETRMSHKDANRLLSFQPGLQCVHGLNNFFSMLLTLWPEKYFFDDAFFINHEGGAVKAHVVAAV